MNVKLLSCWFTTSYGTYTSGLRRALQLRLGREVGVITSNCGCGDPMEINRKFVDGRCQFVEFPNVPYWEMSTTAKQWVLDTTRHLVHRERARRYLKLSGDADVLHFQQILNAFGSVTVFQWLSLPSRSARVVTVHELDPYQQAHPRTTAGYNMADGVIVHTVEMRRALVGLGVEEQRIHVIPHGVDLIPPAREDGGSRTGIIFYGGHKLHTGKGVTTLFAALSLLKERIGSQLPVLTIHGHYGDKAPAYGVEQAKRHGVAGHVRWLNEIPHEAAVVEYQRALVCVLPYTGSFAGYAATLAMAAGTPVVATRHAGLPEHLGDAAAWVDHDDPAELAAAIARLLEDEGERRRLADRARRRAEQEVSWDAVAQRTLACYREAVGRRQRAPAARSA